MRIVDEQAPDAISAISIKGFKSFFAEQRVEIRPLTLLAGANSAGKSSALQPLLLLKQTLEAPFDPGPLLLDGPNVRFTSASQFFSSREEQVVRKEFSVVIEKDKRHSLENLFEIVGNHGVDLVHTAIKAPGDSHLFTAAMAAVDIGNVFRFGPFYDLDPGGLVEPYRKLILSILHVPGLRGNRSRGYSTASVGVFFPGTFENYVASLILDWRRSGDWRYKELNRSLEILGLTRRIQPETIHATQIEILVGRPPATRQSSSEDLVNIADVGFGVSQVLPVLVALLVAKPGQFVYLEQPELHLHPRAQQALATVLADAAIRGVRVVAETHSSILLLAVQTLVAEGKLSPDLVKLHWFQRDDRGATQVTSAGLDQLGAYGDWPQDFGAVEAAADNRYLDAVESKAFPRKKRAKK